MELTIGEKIRALREDLDMNQTELGNALNMSQRKISYMECGKYPPSVEDLYAICNYFGISADYFLGLKKGLKYPER